MKTQSLESLRVVYADKSTDEIRDEFSRNHSIFSTLSQDSFQWFSWDMLKSVKYATTSYTPSTKLDLLLEFIFGINGIQYDFVFLDAFCLDRPKKDLDSDKVFSALRNIYAGSSEHHIMEPGSLMRGWVWHDLSFVIGTLRPTLHSSTIDTALIAMLIKNIKANGFKTGKFSLPTDEEKVRNSIIDRWTTIEDFNQRVVETVVSSLELSQVCYCLLW